MAKYFFYIVLLLYPALESRSQDITTGLIAYWSFNDSTAKDHSGHGYDGTIQNSPTFVSGKDGAAIKLKGYGINTTLGDHVLLPWIDFNSMTEFTLSLWVWEEGFAGTGGPSEGYIWWGDWNAGWLGVHHHCQQQPYIDFTKQFIRFSVGNKGIEADCFNVPFDSTDMFKWVNYVMTYKNGLLKCYKNGNFLGGTSQFVSVAQGQGAIGRHWWMNFTQTSSRLNAIIDEVKIYNRELTPKDVKKLSEDCNGLIACWNFEDSTAKDVSGNGYNGKMMYNPTPVLGHNGKGTALHFTGNGVNDSTGSHILLPMINFNNYSEFSLTMWVNCEGFTIPHGDAYIFFGDWDKGWLGITNHYNHINPPDKTWINFAVGSHLHDNQITVDYNPSQDNNKWFHYCLTHNNGLTKAYINGVFVGQKAQTTDIYGNYAAIARSWWIDGNVTSTRFNGSIDDVKIFCTALSDSDVAKDYQEVSITSRTHIICDGDTLTLFGTPGFNSYQWSTGETTDKIVINKPGLYSCKAFFLGVGYKDEFLVESVSPQKPDIKVLSLPCSGKAGELKIDGNYKSVKWSTGDTSRNTRVYLKGLYTVTVNDTNGCNSYAEINVDEIMPQKIKLTVKGSLTNCGTDTVKISSPDNLLIYEWYEANSSQAAISTETLLKVTKAGKYYLTGRNADSCLVSSDTVEIKTNYGQTITGITGVTERGLDFDTTSWGGTVRKKLTLINGSVKAVIVTGAHFQKNTEFSVPQSQFNIRIDSMSVADLEVCFSAKKAGNNYDTLVITDICGDTLIPAKAFTIPNKYEAMSECGLGLQLSTDKKYVQDGIYLGAPYPNPSAGTVEISYIKKKPVDKPVDLKIEITDLLESESLTFNTLDIKTDENSKIESGLMEINLEKYPSGIYFLIFSQKGLNFAVKLIEVRK